MDIKKETAIFGMGCFWTPDLMFSKLDGVLNTEVGYTGGDEKKYPKPTYEQVCNDKTGYVEVVQITFNPLKISYKELLNVFWKNHNPTTLNRQGFDIGSQYRSVIFYRNLKQKKLALKSKKDVRKMFDKKIVTEIVKVGKFFPAEEYHQKYLEKHGMQSCHVNF